MARKQIKEREPAGVEDSPAEEAGESAAERKMESAERSKGLKKAGSKDKGKARHKGVM